MAHVDSASDDRTANNAVRHQYRVLSDAEKAQMVAVKDAGAALLNAINACYPKLPDYADPQFESRALDYPNVRALHIATQKAEEAVMWAVKHITA